MNEPPVPSCRATLSAAEVLRRVLAACFAAIGAATPAVLLAAAKYARRPKPSGELSAIITVGLIAVIVAVVRAVLHYGPWIDARLTSASPWQRCRTIGRLVLAGFGSAVLTCLVLGVLVGATWLGLFALVAIVFSSGGGAIGG